MAILETFPNKGGHTFTDADSPITNRDTVNLIDFDIDDDSTNEKTDINPHRLTSEELDEIVAGIPDGYNDMPVVYDERGTEYVIGRYIKSDGTETPLYQKVYNLGALPNNSKKTLNIGITGLAKIVRIYGVAQTTSGSDVIPLPFADPAMASYQVGLYTYNGQINLSTKSDYSAYTDSYITLEYIKD